jgi:hypothetical protein
MARANFSLLLLSLTAAALAPAARASSQGLYAIAPTTGQLLLVNQSDGTRLPIGPGLAALGWVVPADCTPTATDTTGKWVYTFARRAGAPPATTPWSVLSLELRDGSIRKEYELPSAFPPSLAACEHGLAEDGAWHAYISAVTRDAAKPPRLVVWRFTYTWPASNESAPLIDVPLAALGMGDAPAGALSTTVTNFSWWISLTDGLVGVDLLSLAPSQTLPLAPGAGARIDGLQYDISGEPRVTYGVLVSAAGQTSVLSFLDAGGSGPVKPARLSPTSVPVAPDVANRVVLANDHGAIVIVSNNAIVTLDLNGTLLARAPACSGGGGGGGGGACPIAVAYEPFVF